MRLAHVSRRLVASTVALVLGASSLAASAQPWHAPGGEGDRYGHSQRGPGHEGRDDWDPRYHRGDRLPPEARQSVMVVQDWRDHRLDPPPRGHDWVRLGRDFVLLAAATGIIAQVILSAGH